MLNQSRAWRSIAYNAIQDTECDAELVENPKATNPSLRIGIKPEFLDDDPLVENGKSMRIYRIENRNEKELHVGESWRVRISRAESNLNTPLTRDGRMKVFIYVDLIRRNTRLGKPRRVDADSRIFIVHDVWSGFVIVGSETWPATERKAIYRIGDRGVVEVIETTARDVTVYGCLPKTLSKFDYLNRLNNEHHRRISSASLESMFKNLTQAPDALMQQMGPIMI